MRAFVAVAGLQQFAQLAEQFAECMRRLVAVALVDRVAHQLAQVLAVRARMFGKLPAIGVVGGFFDERKGIRKAAYAAADLLNSGSFRIRPV